MTAFTFDWVVTMGKQAPRVVVESDAIRYLESLIGKLPGNARVSVLCADGNEVGGIVCVRPTVQAFRDRAGREGINGILRLEDAAAPGGEHHVWLDQIRAVRQLVSPGVAVRA